MIKAFLFAALLAAFCGVAQAAPSAPGRQITAAPQTYWLSDGINRLVFWHPPAAEAAQANRSAH